MATEANAGAETAKQPVQSRSGLTLSQEALRDFKEKSLWMVPQCFGGYDEDDVVCREWCSRATSKQLDWQAHDIRKRLNEDGSFGLFRQNFDLLHSCENAHKEKIKRLEQLQEDIRHSDEARHGRDTQLQVGSKNFRRIPVGEVRFVQGFPDFTERRRAFLETKDGSFFTHPYGPAYDDAMGRLFDIIPGGAGPEDSEVQLGYVKAISPELPERALYPVKIIAQKENAEGDLALTAEIRHRLHSDSLDRHGTEGKIVTVTLYGKSAKRSFRADDRGRL